MKNATLLFIAIFILAAGCQGEKNNINENGEVAILAHYPDFRLESLTQQDFLWRSQSIRELDEITDDFEAVLPESLPSDSCHSILEETKNIKGRLQDFEDMHQKILEGNPQKYDTLNAEYGQGNYVPDMNQILIKLQELGIGVHEVIIDLPCYKSDETCDQLCCRQFPYASCCFPSFGILSREKPAPEMFKSQIVYMYPKEIGEITLGIDAPDGPIGLEGTNHLPIDGLQIKGASFNGDLNIITFDLNDVPESIDLIRFTINLEQGGQTETYHTYTRLIPFSGFK